MENNSKNKNITFIVLIILLLGGFIAWYFPSQEKPQNIQVTNFEECLAAGNPAMESYPRQCRHGDRTFVEEIQEPEILDGFGDPGDGVVGILPFESGVFGQVILGPTCPVIKEGDDSCADKPYVTKVQVIVKGSPLSSPSSVVDTDKEGNYRVMLPPGEFALQAVGGQPFPSCETKEITIDPDKMLEVDLSCDTGIR